MARKRKSYEQLNKESIQKTGKTLYQKRIESGKGRGLSKDQSRGHANVKKGEKKPSELHPRPKKAPTIKERERTLRSGTRAVATKSINVVRKKMEANRGKHMHTQYRNKNTGHIVPVYKTKGGVAVDDVLARIQARMDETGEEWGDAFEDIIEGDSGTEDDSPKGEGTGDTFTYGVFYFR